MPLQQIVIIDQTGKINAELMHAAALALNQQVRQDLPKYWTGINAGVSYAPSLQSLQTNAWPVFLATGLPPDEGGFHLDNNNQPYAKVEVSPSDPSWTLDASHEIIEMLIDPYGNRLKTAPAIAISGDDVVEGSGQFSYLVEACDPCEAKTFAYDIDGIAVSDFITPHFYDAAKTAGTAYSFTGSITRPRQVLPGGYISYMDEHGAWMQILWADPSKPPSYQTLSVASVQPTPPAQPTTPSLSASAVHAVSNFREQTHRLMTHTEAGVVLKSRKIATQFTPEVQKHIDHGVTRRDPAIATARVIALKKRYRLS
jgi:hypothetical protein